MPLRAPRRQGPGAGQPRPSRAASSRSGDDESCDRVHRVRERVNDGARRWVAPVRCASTVKLVASAASCGTAGRAFGLGGVRSETSGGW